MYFKPIVAAVLMSLSSKATSVQAAPTELDTRQTAYAQIQGFHDNNCSGNSDVLTDFQANNGACLTLGGYAAVKVTQIGVGCTGRSTVPTPCAHTTTSSEYSREKCES